MDVNNRLTHGEKDGKQLTRVIWSTNNAILYLQSTCLFNRLAHRRQFDLHRRLRLSELLFVCPSSCLLLRQSLS